MVRRWSNTSGSSDNLHLSLFNGEDDGEALFSNLEGIKPYVFEPEDCEGFNLRRTTSPHAWAQLRAGILRYLLFFFLFFFCCENLENPRFSRQQHGDVNQNRTERSSRESFYASVVGDWKDEPGGDGRRRSR